MKFEIGKIYKSFDWENTSEKNSYKTGCEKNKCDWVLPPSSNFIVLEYVVSSGNINQIYNLKILFEGKVGWIYSTNLEMLAEEL